MTDTPKNSINFERAAGFYDATRGFAPGAESKAAALIAEAGNITSKSRVIEIGIGSGRVALPLAHHAGVIFGADISTGMLHRLLEKRNSAPVYPAQADAVLLPYPDNAFDAAVVVHVFHLVADLPGVIKELARVLKPGSRLAHCYNRDDTSYRELINTWREPLGIDMTARWDQVDSALPDAGWHQVGAPLTFDYTKQNSPQELVDLFGKRAWSATWNLTDEQLALGSGAMQSYVDTHYDDPTQPITVTHTFHAATYTPPA